MGVAVAGERWSQATIAVLLAVSRGARHGFDAMDVTGLASGTVYPILARLERSGYLRSRWENPTIARREKRPSRKYYEVTPVGESALETALERLRGLTGETGLDQWAGAQ